MTSDALITQEVVAAVLTYLEQMTAGAWPEMSHELETALHAVCVDLADDQPEAAAELLLYTIDSGLSAEAALLISALGVSRAAALARHIEDNHMRSLAFESLARYVSELDQPDVALVNLLIDEAGRTPIADVSIYALGRVDLEAAIALVLTLSASDRPNSGLQWLAFEVAKTDLARARTIVELIHDVSVASDALRRIGAELIAVDPASARVLLEDASSMADPGDQYIWPRIVEDMARADLDRAVEIAMSLPEPIRETCLSGIARICVRTVIDRSIDIAESLSSTSRRRALLDLATAIAAGDPDRALDLAHGLPSDASDLIHGAVLRGLGDGDSDLAETLVAKISNPKLQGHAWSSLAQRTKLTDPERAKRYWIRALSQAELIDSTHFQSKALERIALGQASLDLEAAEATLALIGPRRSERTAATVDIAGFLANTDLGQAVAFASSSPSDAAQALALADICSRRSDHVDDETTAIAQQSIEALLRVPATGRAHLVRQVVVRLADYQLDLGLEVLNRAHHASPTTWLMPHAVLMAAHGADGRALLDSLRGTKGESEAHLLVRLAEQTPAVPRADENWDTRSAALEQLLYLCDAVG